MIGRLRGILLEKQPPELLVETSSGMAYEIYASMQTFYQLPVSGQEIILYTHLIVREDSQQLYGFYDKEERALFRILLKVNGVGPKSALAILSSVSPEEFRRCIYQGDTASLVKLPGVGKKTAERLVIEMRDRLGGMGADKLPGIFPAAYAQSPREDALSALVALGYKPLDALRVLKNVPEEDNISSEDLIRFALKNF